MYLTDLGFEEIDIKEVQTHTPELVLEKLEEFKDLVVENISFLKDLGIKNYKDVVINYADMFLMDSSNFQNIFLKYDTADLIEKIAKNVAIVEHL